MPGVPRGPTEARCRSAWSMTISSSQCENCVLQYLFSAIKVGPAEPRQKAIRCQSI